MLISAVLSLQKLNEQIATISFQNHVLVLGGYRSSSENALSCYRHREEDSILDYEDHLDYSWWYAPPTPDKAAGEWTFGGGTTTFSHRNSMATSDMTAAVAAASASHSTSIGNTLPCSAPVPVRGASSTIYQGKITLFGGLSVFSRTFYDKERQTIWQFYSDSREWRRAPMTLPVPAVLDSYAFSVTF